MRIFILLALILAFDGLCLAQRETILSEKFQGGYFVTKDGRRQAVDAFTNLTSLHSFLCRSQGVVVPISVSEIKRLEDLGGARIQVTKRNGKVQTVEPWGRSGRGCMEFVYYRAEWSFYVKELNYDFYDAREKRYHRSKVSLCDIQKIVFD